MNCHFRSLKTIFQHLEGSQVQIRVKIGCKNSPLFIFFFAFWGSPWYPLQAPKEFFKFHSTFNLTPLKKEGCPVALFSFGTFFPLEKWAPFSGISQFPRIRKSLRKKRSLKINILSGTILMEGDFKLWYYMDVQG